MGQSQIIHSLLYPDLLPKEKQILFRRLDNSLKGRKIKNMIIGINGENVKSLSNMIFGNNIRYTSLFFLYENNSGEGVMAQYGKFKYEKDKKEFFGIKLDNYCWYPYKEKGGLIFAEMDFNTYIKKFCSIAKIKIYLDKKMYFYEFLEKIKKNNEWDYNSYNINKHNCHDFVAEAIKIFNFEYKPTSLKILDESLLEEEDEIIIPSVILKILKNKMNDNIENNSENNDNEKNYNNNNVKEISDNIENDNKNNVNEIGNNFENDNKIKENENNKYKNNDNKKINENKDKKNNINERKIISIKLMII